MDLSRRCWLWESGLRTARRSSGRYEEALNEPHARLMDFTKRSMRGYVYVDPPGYSTDAALRTWLGKGVAYARSLPPKDRKK